LKIVFVGPDDSGRAPMAAAFAKKYLDEKVEIVSVGLEPGRPDPIAIKVMSEIGIDISDHESSHVDGEHLVGANYIIFVSLSKGPIKTGSIKQIVWPIPDPRDLPCKDEDIISRFRDTRTALEKHSIALSKIIKNKI
jgi:arsenate reductase (thioredoxin)